MFHGATHINCWGLIGRVEHLATAIIAHFKKKKRKKRKNNWIICEQNPLSQIPVFPLSLSSPQEKPARTATAEIMLRYISGPRQVQRHREAELTQ